MKSNTDTGPSSSIGILKFNTESGGPKIKPEIVLIICAVISLIIIVAKIIIG
ncbi:MAG: preprotein translocase subunit Sec61beta [Candidatus Diapherotrites archaeon]